jgi:hypothetical protein
LNLGKKNYNLADENIFTTKQMKNLLLLLFVAWTNLASAQWNNDPANPLVVSNEQNFQNGPQSYPDGEGGAYIMWQDDRTTYGKKEVYGQHVDADGNDLWEEGGRLILTDTKDIEWFRFIRYASDGKMIISWYAADDGVANPDDKLWVQELDNEGMKVWANDLAISEESPVGSLSVGYFINVIIKRDALGFQVCMMILTYGYDRIRMSRFSEDGSLMMALNGVEIGPLSIGNVSMTSDGGTGAYVYYSSSNGAGAALMCMRVDAYGEELWENWVSAADANGLSYQFSAIGDDAGVTFVWQGNGVNAENLYARRLHPDGSFDWSGNVLAICVAAGAQSNFHWIRSGSEYYITWADGRPGVVGFYAIYAQKFTNSGQTLWADDGVMVANLSTYSPYPRATFAPDGFIYISHESTVNGYVFQKLNTDGELQWDADGEQVAITSVMPNPNTRSEFISGDNLLAVWGVGLSAGGQDGIYMNRVADLTPVTIIQENVSSCDTYTYEDVTYDESGLYEIEIGEDSILQLNLTLLQSSTSQLEVDVCEEFVLNGTIYDESGTYTQVVSNEAGCDSTITLNLSIQNVNNEVTLNGITLTASESNATSYIWVDCATGEGVGEFTQSFTPTVSGSYQVSLIVGDCSSLSDCINVVIINVDDFEGDRISVYPNPFEDVLMVQSDSDHLIMNVCILDATGRMVLNEAINAKSKELSLERLESGHYTLVVESAQGKTTKQLTKK